MEVTIGMKVEANDGPVGELADIVVNPVNWSVTHLVVEPHHHHEKSRLVPMTAVASVDEQIVLSWSSEEVGQAPPVVETEFITVDTDRWQGGSRSRGSVLSWPYYPYRGPASAYAVGYPFSPGIGFDLGPSVPRVVATKIERVPTGTVEVRRASEVVSSDDHVVGRVDGFVLANDGGITHLVLERGHLWGHRDVTIPIDDIDGASWKRVDLKVTRDAVGEYPEVPFRRHHHEPALTKLGASVDAERQS